MKAELAYKKAITLLGGNWNKEDYIFSVDLALKSPSHLSLFPELDGLGEIEVKDALQSITKEIYLKGWEDGDKNRCQQVKIALGL